jgi:hypothetical protein
VDEAILGAFLSGVGAVLSALVSLRTARKRAEAECEKRMDALREGFRMRGE